MSNSKINWTSLALEFLVVLIGILLAFQLNECSGRKKSRKLIAQHIEAIDEEAKFNKIMLTMAIDSLERSIGKLGNLLTAIEKEDAEECNRLMLETLSNPGLFVKDNAYKTLIESGDVRLMEDFEKKNYLVYMYSYFDWARELDKLEAQQMDQYYFPYVFENMDLVKGKTQEMSIYKDKQFRNVIASGLFTQRMRLDKYKECLKIIEEY